MVLSMTNIVRQMRDEFQYSDEKIQELLGMEQEEIERLYDFAPMTEKGGGEEFSKGWVPDTGDRAFD